MMCNFKHFNKLIEDYRSATRERDDFLSNCTRKLNEDMNEEERNEAEKIHQKIVSIKKTINDEKICVNINIKDPGRFIFGLLYLALFVTPFFLDINLFYNEPIENFENWPRLIFCIAFSSLGFFFSAFSASKFIHEKSALQDGYLTKYPITLILLSSLVFGLFSAVEITNNYVYYFISAPICTIFAYHIDRLLQFDPLKVLKNT